ncbi:MAG TPA: cation:proton antiporter, partial [Bacteroidales bacterium]|nr:cation:proton antiporter [Bacteroidales bacterium]
MGILFFIKVQWSIKNIRTLGYTKTANTTYIKTMEIPLLKEILILFSVSVLLLLILNRVKIPSVVGYLLAGIIVGPFALGFVKESHQIEVLAEIGIILLLFSIGIEFSLKTLLKVKSMIFIGGTLQILLTTAAIMGIAMFFGALAKEAAFIGLLVSLSSTAIVLKVIQDNGTVDTPRGRISLAMLILQDIAIVP